MSARFHRFADFAPDDVEWWQGEAGLLESYVGEWLPAVVRVRQGRVRVEAPVTGAESAVRVLRDFRIGGACAARDGWRLFGGGFASVAVARRRGAPALPAAAARDALRRRGASSLAGGTALSGAGKAPPFRTSKEKRVACREFELMRRVGRECATAHVVRLLEAFECDAEAEAEPAADEPATEAEALEAEAADEAAEPEPEGAEAAGAEAEAVGAEPESEAAPEPDADAVEAEGAEAEGAEAEGAEAEAVEAEAESEAAPEPGTEAVEADAAADSEAEPERPDATPTRTPTRRATSPRGYGDIPDDAFPDDDYKSRRYDDDDFDYGKSYERTRGSTSTATRTRTRATSAPRRRRR
ncbi:calmodulin-dependent protein kinase [Aureococcus anophagefferens]|uniref:Calmodulin-dependent protein kinase n=1 Tax=Aureococcus anophagefferens TaxID=44056 RepID=A0ABR1G041_AURAN